MKELEIMPTPGGDGYQVRGRLVFATVPGLYKESVELFAGVDAIEVDLQGVTLADSAGMALLIEWMRLAKNQGKSIYFKNIPAQMQSIAKVSGLEGLLPVK